MKFVLPNTKYRQVFLDLEDTVIDEYIHNEMIVNKDKVKLFLTEHNVTAVNIFSFVMQNSQLISHFDDDLHYNKSLRQKLQDEFGVLISEIPTVPEIIKWSSKLRHMNTISMNDYFDYFSKERGFIEMVKYNMKYKKETDITYVLIDDMVDSQIIEFGIPDKKVFAYLINVNDL